MTWKDVNQSIGSLNGLKHVTSPFRACFLFCNWGRKMLCMTKADNDRRAGSVSRITRHFLHTECYCYIPCGFVKEMSSTVGMRLFGYILSHRYNPSSCCHHAVPSLPGGFPCTRKVNHQPRFVIVLVWCPLKGVHSLCSLVWNAHCISSLIHESVFFYMLPAFLDASVDFHFNFLPAFLVIAY